MSWAAGKINGSDIVGGGNSRSGVACGSTRMQHCCCSPFNLKDADRDLLRLLLTTSAARAQFRSSWVFRFHLLTFLAAIADVRFWSQAPAFMRTFLRTSRYTVTSAKAAPTAPTCEDCGVRFISRLEYKIQLEAWRHVYVRIRLYHGECT